MELSRSQPGADLAVQRGGLVRRAKRLVVFDLSWTLLQGESMETLLAAAGIAVPADGDGAAEEVRAVAGEVGGRGDGGEGAEGGREGVAAGTRGTGCGRVAAAVSAPPLGRAASDSHAQPAPAPG